MENTITLKDYIVPETIKYQNIFNNMQEGCAILDFNWNYIYVNPANARHAHKTVEEMTGKSIFEIVPGVEKSIFYEIYKICMEERIPQNKTASFTFADGSVNWYDVRALPVPEGLFILSIDITEQKLYEEKIKTQKELFEKVLELIPTGVFIMDKNGNKVIGNKMHEETWKGMRYEEVRDAAKYIGWYADTGKQIQPEEWASNKALQGEATVNEELIIQCFDGSFKNIYNSAVPIFSPDGQVEGVIVVNVDITALKEKEKALTESQNSLNLALKEKEMLLREIHHRVKNNMQVIQSLLSLQASYFEDQKVIEAFDASRSRIKAMAIVHEQLYSTKKLSSIEFDKYVKDLISKLEVTYAPLGVALRLNINAEKIVISINTALNMGLIINELLINSLKHAFPDKRTGTISVDIHKEDDNIKIVIADDGIGIPEDVDPASTESFGMILVHNLLDQYNCTIELDRTSGTKFTITLPYSKAIAGIVEIKDR